MNYRIDVQSLQMISDLIHMILSGKHTGSDAQKDLILAQRGLDILVKEMINYEVKA